MLKWWKRRRTLKNLKALENFYLGYMDWHFDDTARISYDVFMDNGASLKFCSELADAQIHNRIYRHCRIRSVKVKS